MSAGLRSGYTTGTCAAAAAKAAVLILNGAAVPDVVTVHLPDSDSVEFSIEMISRTAESVEVAVRKDAGDDPDITHQLRIHSRVEWTCGDAVAFAAGEGVGVVTKPGLSVSPGEPAINPAPRLAIEAAVREVTRRGVLVTVSIPGGRELAKKTFNPRLGIEGGLSILGTSGRVRPFSVPAMLESLKCALDVAAASGINRPVLVPGNIGERAARKNFELGADQVIQVSNQWGYMLDAAAQRPFERMLVVGHPGKLAKMIDGEWDTHSAQSESAVPIVTRLAREMLSLDISPSETVEGVLMTLDSRSRERLADALAERIQNALQHRIAHRFLISVALINMNGDIVGRAGETNSWQ